MKVLLVNYSDSDGGAARASFRLLKALQKIGVDVQLLVVDKKTNNKGVVEIGGIGSRVLIKFISRLENFLSRVLFDNNQFITLNFINSYIVNRKIRSIKPDILHLHWYARGMLSVDDISKLKFKTVITLHDNNFFTGGCHIKSGCNKYIEDCKSCPYITRNKKIFSLLFKRKLIRQKKIDPYIVALSEWMKNELQKVDLIKKEKIYEILNPLDTNEFSPINKDEAKRIVGKEGKKIILFGACNPQDKNKGFDLLIKAIKRIENQFDDLELFVFGDTKEEFFQKQPFNVNIIGKLHDDIALRVYYSAADVMIVPSLQETLPQSATEALSCGTPVVGFENTGLTSLVNHKVNGFLAKHGDCDELSYGIQFVLNNNIENKLNIESRALSKEKFTDTVVAKEYLSMYENILSD
ncbi:Glycosyl transferase, group 1 [Photobacterium angustum S14]|uniref:Glycosyl transferase, group 1 n=1 Tax=Photobacterium angustum (strain S14 / CCUG 15956) TaxID=314292 RepID=Q1ZRU1_PHOAS|nr:glycosyltransferase [Photobacterium angustum]EAS65236.1 Glycosyl transferase, group 1 [Photobacterium angustum S14]